MKISLFLLCVIAPVLWAAGYASAAGHGMFSEKPAAKWQEAFVTGNGTLGAMVSGKTDREQVYFNHEKLYRPAKKQEQVPPPDIARFVPGMQKLILQGKYREGYSHWWSKAMKEAGWDKVLGGKNIIWTDIYHCAYSMQIKYPDSSADVKNYVRRTDFTTGEVRVSWDAGGSSFTSRTFVSRADGVIVQQIERSGGPVNIAISLHAAGKGLIGDPVEAADGWLAFRFKYDRDHKRGYNGFTRVVPFGGKATVEGDSVAVKGAKKVLLLTRIESIEDYDKDAKSVEAKTKKDLSGLGTDFDKLLKRHAAIHREIFMRCLVDFNAGPDMDLSNEALLAKQKQQAKQNKLNVALTQKLYEMGRFAFICSAGEWPQNLTAMWNGAWSAGWSGDFTTDTNVNLQIAGTNIGNIREGIMAYTRLILGQVDDWEYNAKAIYGCRGVMAPTRTDGRSGYAFHSSKGFAGWTWTAGAGWLAYPMYEYYEVSGDEAYLKEKVLPLYKKIALFYEDFLKHRDKDGKYIYVPSYSPENRARIRGGGSSSCTVNATMDIAVCKQVLTILIDECERLGIEKAGVKKWKKIRSDLPDYMYNENGSLKEWAHKDLMDNNKHRHACHLYPAWLAFEADPDQNPKLFKGTRQALYDRYNGFDYKMGSAHGLLFRAFGAARLREDKVLKADFLALFANRYVLPSLFTYHDPGRTYNADFICSFPGLVIEMLVFSRQGFVELLPALPDDLAAGSASGILCRGQIKVDRMSWDLKKKTASVSLTSKKKQDVKFILRRGMASVKVNGRGASVAGDGKTLALSLDEGKTAKLDITLR